MDYSKLSLREKVFQTFVLDPRQITVSGLSLEEFFEKYPVGALYFTIGKAPDLVVKNEGDCELDAEAIATAKRVSKHPLLVCADGMPIEKGRYMSSINSLGACGDEALAYEYGRAMGMSLNRYGVDWVLGPAVDMCLSRTGDTISDAMTDDPEYAVKINRQIIRGIQSQNIACTLKHFPGLGTHHVNMHAGHGQNVLSRDEWFNTYGVLYKGLFKEDPECVMTSHVCFEAYSDKADYGSIPIATYSKDITVKLLKKELGFKGAVVTDALIMGGMVYGDPVDEAVAAFACGADLLLWPDMRAGDEIVRRLESGEIPMSRLDDALERIARLRKKIGCFDGDRENVPEYDTEYPVKISDEIAGRAIELVRNKLGVLPIRKAGRVLIDLISPPLARYDMGVESAHVIGKELEKRGFSYELVRNEVQFMKEEADEVTKDFDYVIVIIDNPFPSRGIDPTSDAIWTVHFFERAKRIVLNFSSPFYADDYYPDVETFVNANSFGFNRAQAREMVKRILGEENFTGKTCLKTRKY